MHTASGSCCTADGRGLTDAKPGLSLMTAVESSFPTLEDDVYRLGHDDIDRSVYLT